MAGVKGMHKKAGIITDETEKERFVFSAAPEYTASEHEEKFLSEVLAGYAYWNKQPGDKAKGYAEAYKTLLNEFTKDEKE